jgi:hypothetical protein
MIEVMFLRNVPSRSYECLPTLATVERLGLIVDGCHSFGYVGMSASGRSAVAPCFNERLRYERALTPLLKWDVLEPDALVGHSHRSSRPCGSLSDWHHRLAWNDLRENEPVSLGRCVQVAQLERQFTLSDLNPQIGPNSPKHHATSSAVDAPHVYGAATPMGVVAVHVVVSSEEFAEQFHCLVIELFHHATRLIRRLFGVLPFACADLVPVDVHANRAVRVHDSRTVGQFYFGRFSHPLECTT